MFHDKTDYTRVFEVGKVYDFTDDERVRTIVGRGLGVIVDANSEATQPTENKAVEVEKTENGVGKVVKPKESASKKKTVKRR